LIKDALDRVDRADAIFDVSLLARLFCEGIDQRVAGCVQHLVAARYLLDALEQLNPPLL
jgi:hypothetical protein